MKQVYPVSYPTGEIYVGKDAIGCSRYFGRPDMDIVNLDFSNLPAHLQEDYTVRKQILWESNTATNSELAAKAIALIRQFQSNIPAIGYNRRPKIKSRREGCD